MYYLQLFSSSYSHYLNKKEIKSVILPRPGDVVMDNDGSTFIVFDIMHMLSDGKCMVVVSAREAAREDRLYVLRENRYLESEDNDEPGCASPCISESFWDEVVSDLPTFREIKES